MSSEPQAQDPQAWRAETASRLAALEADRADAAYARRLHGAIIRLAVLGELATPISHHELLELLVRTAAQVLGAQSASLLLLDRATQELVFEVALGSAADEARKFRVPVGQGIAGWVASSGQPVARSDVAQDTHFAADMAQRIGYVPKTVLAIPLRLGEDVVGVIEVFDKPHGHPFTADDMEVLDQFGRAAAAAIEQSQVMGDLTLLFQFVLRHLLDDSTDGEVLRADAHTVVERSVLSERYRDSVSLAMLLGEIVGRGAPARRHCLETLNSLATLLREQDRRNNLEEWLP